MILLAGDLLLDVLLLPELQREEQPAGILLRSGGSAANTAAWVVRYGRPATFVGCVGRDAVGAGLVAELDAAGVRTAVRVDASLETGVVAVEVTPQGERVMRSSRGANMALAPGDILRVEPAGLAAVHVTGYALLGPFEFHLLEAASRLARAANVRLSFDPSSAGVIRRFGRERMLNEIARCGVDLLLPNHLEAEALTGHADIARAAAMLGEVAPVAVIKDGAGGAVWCEGGHTQRVETAPVRPLDTTGAGDAFNAGVLVGPTDDLHAGIQMGHAAARTVIMQYGARPPLPATSP